MPSAVYVHGAGTDSPILRLTGTTNTSAATQAAYLQDGLGSVVGLVTPTGTLSANQRFDAWGNRTAGSGSVPQYGYTGREPDATGLTYYRARYYHAGIGRFLTRDPAGMVDSVSPYAYVANNPVNLVDPFGLQAQLVTPASQSSYPQNVQVAMAPVVAGATMTDVTAGVIGSGVGNQSLNGGRGAGSNVDTLAPQKDSGSGSSNPISGALEQLGGFVNGALMGLGTLINSPGQAIENFKNNVFGNILNQEVNSEGQQDVTKRPSRVRKGTEQANWDNAADGQNGGKVCPTCGGEVNSKPREKNKDWDNDHNPPWRDRDLSGKDRKGVLDEYNRDTRLRCVGCNRSDNGN